MIASLTLGLLQAAPVTPARSSQPTGPAATPTRTQPTAQPTPATTAPAAAPAPAEAPPSLPPDPNAAPDPFTAPAEPAPAPAPAAPAPAAPDGIYYMADAAPTTPEVPPATVEQVDLLKYRRLVFSNFYTLNFGVYPIPSGDMSVFLGTNLRPRKSSLGTDWNTAIGYQITLSLGYADIGISENSNAIQNRLCPDAQDFCFNEAIFFHRHSLMAQGHGGRRSRLYYALGGGAIMWNSLLVGIEAEGKLGYIFSKSEGSRLKGILGGQLRLGGAFDGFPLPQFGFFIGFMVF